MLNGLSGHEKNATESLDSEIGVSEARMSLFSVSGFSRLILAILSAYFVYASIAVCWMDVEELRLFNVYYLAAAGLIGYVGFSTIREIDFRRKNSFLRQDLIRVVVIGLFGMAAWVIYRYPQLFSFSLWLDEITQFQGDWNLPRQVTDPALFAAIQQQPPTDYYLSAFARNVLGMNEFAALIHAVAFGFLSFIAFLLWLIQIRFPLVLAPIPILLFAAHHTLLRFSSEARPISLSVLFAMLTLIFTYESVMRKKVCVRALGASASWLLYSIGLQPMFFIGALSLGLLPLALRHFERKETIKLFLALCAAPLLIFAPTLWEIYRESASQRQFATASFWQIWWNALHSMQWGEFWGYRLTMKKALWTFAIPLVAAMLICLFRKWKIGKFPAAAVSWALAALIFSISFPVSFQVFWSIVNWTQNFYYFVLWPVGHFALVSLCVAYLFRPVSESRYRTWASLALALLCGFGIHSLHKSYVPAHRKQITFDFNFRPNWHIVIKLAKDSPRPVMVIEVPYGEFGWPPYHATSGHFYEELPNFRIVRLDVWKKNTFGVQTFRIGETIKAVDQPTDVMFLMMLTDLPEEQNGQARKEKLLKALRANSDEVVQLSQKMYLLRASNLTSPIAKTEELFQAIVEADPTSDRNFYLADTLVNESIRAGKCDPARHWLGLMEAAVPASAKLPESNVARYISALEKKISKSSSCGNMTAGRHESAEATRRQSKL